MLRHSLALVYALTLSPSCAFIVPTSLAPRSNPPVANDQTRTSLGSTVSSNEDLKPGIAAINEANSQMMDQLNELRKAQDFRLYSVDILASCEYMPQELFECYSETCEVYPIDEEEVREMNAII